MTAPTLNRADCPAAQDVQALTKAAIAEGDEMTAQRDKPCHCGGTGIARDRTPMGSVTVYLCRDCPVGRAHIERERAFRARQAQKEAK